MEGGPAGKGRGPEGLDHRDGGLGHGEDPGRRLANFGQGLRGRREAHHQLEGGQRDEDDHRQQDATQGARAHRGDSHHETAPAGQARQQGGEGQPDAGRVGRGGGDGCQVGVMSLHGFELGLGGTEGHQFGGTLDEIDHGHAELSPHVGEPRFPPLRQGSGEPRHHGGRQATGRQPAPGRRPGASTT